MKGRRALLAVTLLVAAAAGVTAQPVPAGPELVLRHGTRVPMTTVQPLSSKRAHQGQRFELEVSEDVRVAGLLVIPKGARGVGEIGRAVPKGMMGRAGSLEVRLLFVEVGDTRIRLDGGAEEHGKSGMAPVALATPLIALGSAFVTGTSALIPAGSAIDGHVYQDVPLARPPAAPGPIQAAGRSDPVRCKIAVTASADGSFEQAGYDASPARLSRLVATTRERFIAAARRLCAAGVLRPADLARFRELVVQNGEGATEPLIYEDSLMGPDFFVFQFTFQDGDPPAPEAFEQALRCWKSPKKPGCYED